MPAPTATSIAARIATAFAAVATLLQVTLANELIACACKVSISACKQRASQAAATGQVESAVRLCVTPDRPHLSGADLGSVRGRHEIVGVPASVC